MKRTDIEWDKHELIVSENDTVTTHWLKQPETIIYNVRFTNIKDVGLVVSGDFGNWFFSRQFIPTASSDTASAGYWIEKLEHHSTQSGYQFSSDKLNDELQKMLADYEESDDWGEVAEFVENADTDNEVIWQAYVINNKPLCLEYEEMPEGKVVHEYLLAVFDAYDEIINRLAGRTNKA